MIRKLHLVGDVSEQNIATLLQICKEQDLFDQVEYIENKHDLEIETERANYFFLLEQIIADNDFNIKMIERKKGNNKEEKQFEKRIFLFSDLKSQENEVFLVSYLLNDPQVREAKFDHNQKILTLETNDPFIYTKIKHVVDAFGEEITVHETIFDKQGVDMRFMGRFVYVAVFFFAFALYIVTRMDPSIITLISGGVMYGLFAYPYCKELVDNLKEKNYLEYDNMILLGTLVLVFINYPLEATATLFVLDFLKASILSFNNQIINRLVVSIDHLASLVEVKEEEENEAKQVEEVEADDILICEAGDLIYFDGEVSSGEATIDGLLMNGDEQPLKVKVGDIIHSGYEIIDGSIEVKVTRTYSESFFNKVYDWSPRHLLKKGYLEIEDNKDTTRFIYAMLILALIEIVFGMVMHDRYVLMGACLTVITSYPYTCITLGPYIYDNAMINAIVNKVLIKDENSLSKIMEWVRNIPQELLNETINLDIAPVQFHLGNYLDEEVRENSDCIYRDKKQLVKVLKMVKATDHVWSRTRYLSYIVKAIGIFAFVMHFTSYMSVIIFTALLSFTILVVIKGLLNKEY